MLCVHIYQEGIHERLTYKSNAADVNHIKCIMQLAEVDSYSGRLKI